LLFIIGYFILYPVWLEKKGTNHANVSKDSFSSNQRFRPDF
jgi:hypothetical protein